MDCNECKREMVNLFDSNVDQAISASLKEHLLQCANCATEYRNMEEILSMLRPCQLPSAPVLLKQNIVDRLSNEENSESTRKRLMGKVNEETPKRKLLWIYAAASIFFILLCMGFFLVSTNKKNALIRQLTLENNMLKGQNITAVSNQQNNVITHKIYDTIYITKIKSEKNTVELVKYVRDTVYKLERDTVYVPIFHADENNLSKNPSADIDRQKTPTEFIFTQGENYKPVKIKNKRRLLRLSNLENKGTSEKEPGPLTLLKTNF
jgi:hypothetical protein